MKWKGWYNMQALERNRLAKTVFIASMAFLCFWIICGSGVEAKENGLKDLATQNGAYSCIEL